MRKAKLKRPNKSVGPTNLDSSFQNVIYKVLESCYVEIDDAKFKEEFEKMQSDFQEIKEGVQNSPSDGSSQISQKQLEKLQKDIAELKQQGMTVILSAHQMAMVEKLADRVLLLNKGQSVLYGQLNDIFEQFNNNVIDVIFEQPIEPEQYALLDTYLSKQLSANHVSITLNEQQSLSQLLPVLIRVGDISELKNQSQSLHSIYLQAVAEHNKQVHQGAVS